ncbi:hypothetical protein LFAB_03685 [Lactiplantibacillus fabifermentans T30PCM01]|uniref:Uncharacterized protein n=1 Tax=Lactiplantibacillus fabifermentans T30PCM01 TaxID=1400520 RepID=W6T9F9_9LACO|nr:hypothetical protein LFAB_03685 [Lactiplantibacillus fabifermentans T30PCM01]
MAASMTVSWQRQVPTFKHKKTPSNWMTLPDYF